MSGLYATDASWLDTAGRLLIVALFVVTGIRNLQKHHVDDHIQRLTMFKAPFPVATFWAGIALEFVGSALVLLDWYPAFGTLCLIVFTVAASALLLRFWEVERELHWPPSCSSLNPLPSDWTMKIGVRPRWSAVKKKARS